MSTRRASRPVAKGSSRPVSGGKKTGPPPAVIDDLFKNGEQGIWLDPTDMATMFQDSAGTIPVTADGQPVTRMLDKSGNGNHVVFENAYLAHDVFGKPYIESERLTRGLVVKDVDFSRDTQVTFWVGLTNYNKTRLASVFEQGDTALTMPGAFSFMVPAADFLNNKTTLWYCGDSGYTAMTIDGDEPPYTAYYSGMIDSISPVMRLRKNGHDKAETSTVKGGRLANSDLHILCRGRPGFGFEGRLYQLVMRGGYTSYDDMLVAEGFVAGKMGQIGPLPSFSADFARNIYRKGIPGTPPATVSLSQMFNIVRNSEGTAFGPDGKMVVVAPNMPRLNYDPVTGKSLGILIEEPRTNMVPSSQLVTGVSSGGGTERGPTGLPHAPLENGFMFPAGEALATRWVYQQGATFPASTQYAFSFFVRYSDGSEPVFPLESAQAVRNPFAVVCDGATVATSRLRISHVGGGLYRIGMTVTSSATPAIRGWGVLQYVGQGAGKPSFVVTGYQIELGAMESSLIPTVNSQVSRAGDVPRTNGPLDWYNPTEGTLLVDFEPGTIGSGNTAVGAWLSQVSVASSIVAVRKANSSGGIFCVIASKTAVVQLNNAAGAKLIPLGQSCKAAVAFDSSGASMCLDGGPVSTKATIDLPAPELLTIGSAGNGQQYCNGHVRQVVYYPVKQLPEYLQGITK